jgi:hypothetical protein
MFSFLNTVKELGLADVTGQIHSRREAHRTRRVVAVEVEDGRPL